MSVKAQAQPARVLVVDDEKSIRVSVCEFLKNAGYKADGAEDVKAAERELARGDFDVVVSDIILPGASGIDLLHRIRENAPNVQVILMTGEPTLDTATDAVRTGACDYLSKPVGKEAILRSVANAARIRRLDDERRRLTEENAAYQRDLERLVQDRTQKLEEALRNWKEATEGTILAMASAIELRDPYTAGHQKRVADLARAIARRMGLSDGEVSAVYFAGLIHDLGKISVPAEILSYPGKLPELGMRLVQEHPSEGFRILQKVNFPWPIAQIILQHHERMDGSGYPQGLSGEAICREARILAVADVVEAMVSHRPYRPALSIDAALEEIESGRGRKYETQVAEACLKIFKEQSFEFGHPDGG